MPRTDPANWAALFNFAGGGLVHMELFGGSTMLQWRTRLSNDEVKALPSTGLIILPAPPDGQVNYPFFTVLNSKIVTPYTNINTLSWMSTFCSMAGSPGQWGSFLVNDPGNSLTQLTQLLTEESSMFVFQVLGLFVPNAVLPTWQRPPNRHFGDFPPIYHASAYNCYIDNQGSGDYTGGHADNELIFDTFYVNSPQQWGI